MIDREKVKAQAQKEIEEEDFKEAVEKYKEKLRITVLDKIFPCVWKVVLSRNKRKMKILEEYKGFDATADPSGLGWSQLLVVAELLGVDIQNCRDRKSIESAINEILEKETQTQG